MALSTGLYMVMYILLFLAALKLKRAKEGYQIPRGIRTASCLAGLVACALTILVGFLPPPGAELGSQWKYGLMIGSGFCLMAAPVLWLWSYRKKAVAKA
jgi:hypothetical protein